MPIKDLLLLCAPAEELFRLAPLAREGVEVLVRPGRTLRETLVLDLGICPDCVEERIKTVFLDGSPVDDLDADAARPGCALALAAAMAGTSPLPRCSQAVPANGLAPYRAMPPRWLWWCSFWWAKMPAVLARLASTW